MQFGKLCVEIIGIVSRVEGPDYKFTKRIDEPRKRINSAVRHLLKVGCLQKLDGNLKVIRKYYYNDSKSDR